MIINTVLISLIAKLGFSCHYSLIMMSELNGDNNLLIEMKQIIKCDINDIFENILVNVEESSEP